MGILNEVFYEKKKIKLGRKFRAEKGQTLYVRLKS